MAREKDFLLAFLLVLTETNSKSTTTFISVFSLHKRKWLRSVFGQGRKLDFGTSPGD